MPDDACGCQKSVREDDELDGMIYNEKFKRDLYICNPKKNTMCNKRGCAWCNGLNMFNQCFCTSYFEYAVKTVDEMEELLYSFQKIVMEAEAKNGIKN